MGVGPYGVPDDGLMSLRSRFVVIADRVDGTMGLI